ncbi:hypothetical protein [Aeromicrobium endophyticum]|uniref:hypothetical protein n=1 Tax=Aeromicrobium endophyticum TaxID=2292704 RepID=UPI0011C37FD6|nr:hypothetical protein [Aeromicrobium endophyticum]
MAAFPPGTIGAKMQTLSHHLRSRSTAGRIGVYFAIVGLSTVVAIVAGLDRVAATAVTAVVLVAVDVAIWLRNNPTRKQIDRRQRKTEGAPTSEAQRSDPTVP